MEDPLKLLEAYTKIGGILVSSGKSEQASTYYSKVFFFLIRHVESWKNILVILIQQEKLKFLNPTSNHTFFFDKNTIAKVIILKEL